ncbi:hypothetical protein A3850_018495 [Lewinella sp. 4G2]|nr:hypothetical protein A3850_018495 [Lewinella sp. 4G2]
MKSAATFTSTPFFRTPTGHRFWLRISAIVIGSFGPIFMLGAWLPTAEAARWSLDLLSWPLDGDTRYTDPDTRFLSALTGGFLMGWGMMVWGISRWVPNEGLNAARRSLVLGFLAWFITDSVGSVLAGAASNVGFNILILLIGVGPLWWRARV